ncbi:MAG: hypothetical protein U5K38_10865 [Woeseiaceae bacterium]|nr:hypothetical protein [Woeseiaceae bacterium]
MQYFDDPAVADALPYDALIDALDAAFRSDGRMPPRTHHVVDVPGRPDATLLLMPAWQPGKALGVKIATVFPDNAERGIALGQCGLPAAGCGKRHGAGRS